MEEVLFKVRSNCEPSLICCGENGGGNSNLLGPGHRACKVPEDDLETDSLVGLGYSHPVWLMEQEEWERLYQERKQAELMSDA